LGDRVLEIVVFLISQLRDDRERLENLEEISAYLKTQGFTENEISSAYSWIINRVQNDSEFYYDEMRNGDSLRVLTEPERQHFSREAVGYVIQLRHLGLLTDEQMEQILERGSTLWPSPVNLEQIKILIDSVLLSDPGYTDSLRETQYYVVDDPDVVN